MTNTKMTKRDRFNQLLAIPAVAEDADLVSFIDHEIELLSRKNGTAKKPTAKQEANEGVKSVILDVMRENPDHLYTVSELMKSCDELSELSNQKISALLRQLKEADLITKTVDKRVSYFSYAKD